MACITHGFCNDDVEIIARLFADDAKAQAGVASGGNSVVICVARVSTGAAEALADVASAGANPQAISAAIEASEANERNKSLLRSMIILLFYGLNTGATGSQRYDSYSPVYLGIGRVMLPCVIAEGGSAFFISSTSTGAARENMSRICQNRKMRDRKIKTVSGGSLFFCLAENIHEAATERAHNIRG